MDKIKEVRSKRPLIFICNQIIVRDLFLFQINWLLYLLIIAAAVVLIIVVAILTALPIAMIVIGNNYGILLNLEIY